MAEKKQNLPEPEVIEDLNINPSDIDTHEMQTVQAGGDTEPVIEKNAGNEANDKAEGKDKKSS